MTITLLNCDCMSFMATQPDGAFDLAIVEFIPCFLQLHTL
jgi:hypothetical protein